ncbi:MAG TPA: Gfo/Idh/MocA family oxidoreductase [Ktedonobacteraceae bacterium]
MGKTFRFGIIGAGVIAPTHAKAISSLPGAELVAVADIVPEKAEQLAETYHLKAYTDARRMLEREELDVVDICTPSGLHGEHACQAMRAGCHIIVEKPMEITLARMDEMLRVQQETGRKMAVISQHRFDAASRRLRALLDEQALGRLVLGNATIPWWRSQGYYDSGAWRSTWALDGGGILMNQSIHSIDLLQWFMGPVKSIRAYTDTLVHQMESEDVAAVALRFASGALGTISATTGAYPGVTTRIEICGNQGSAIIENDQMRYLHLARDEKEAVGAYGQANRQIESENAREGTANDPAALNADTHALQIADMLRAIREDGKPLIDGYAARHPVEIILGVYEASRTSKEIVLS